MYELDINFLRDRPEYYSNRDSKRILPILQGKLLYFTLASSTLLPVLVAVGWLLLQNQSAQLEKNSGNLDVQLNSLDSQLQQAKAVQVETDKVNRETQALTSVFNRLRPWSAILQDLGDHIPAAVQIETIKQIASSAVPQQVVSTSNSASPASAQVASASNAAGGIEISGMASTFNDVNDFLITLQQSALFKPADIKIVTAELIDSPIPVAGDVSRTAKSEVVKPPQIVQYAIQASLSDTPANKLSQELEHDGAIGLVARIHALQLKGEPTRKALPHPYIQKSGSPSGAGRDFRISRSSNKPERQQITLKNSVLTLNKSLRKSVSAPKKERSETAASAYPSVFGLALTPALGSALIATLGTAGFLYLLLRKVIPVGKKRRNAMEYQLQVIPELSGEAEIFTQAEHRLAQLPLSMPNKKSFDMLMLDLYQMIKVGTKLTRFVLSEQPAEVIANASLESLLDNELELRVVNIGFEATGEQTESILKYIDSLQPLLIVKDHQSTLAPKPLADAKGMAVRGPASINTSFQLQAIMPVSSAETALATGNGK